VKTTLEPAMTYVMQFLSLLHGGVKAKVARLCGNTSQHVGNLFISPWNHESQMWI